MIPIGDSKIEGARTAFLTFLFIILNVAAFIYELSFSQYELQAFINQFGAVPTKILAGEHLYSLITSMFLHGGWMHLIGNMLFLWVFGDNIEHEYGHLGFFLFYMAGGFFATAIHIYFNQESNIPSVGASGAISAVLGAYLVIYPKSKIRMLLILGFFITTIRINAFIFLGYWIVLQTVSGVADITSSAAQTSGVAFWAHIGGFVFGLIVGLAGLIFRNKKSD